MDVRSYDPALARWTGIDPITHHSMSPYTAFDNNPVYWADPSGADAAATVTQGILGIGTLTGEMLATSAFGQHQVSLGAGGGGNSSGSSDKEKDPPNKYQRYFKQQKEWTKKETELGLLRKENTPENDFFGISETTPIRRFNRTATESSPGLSWRTPAGIGAILSGTKFTFLKPVGALGSSRGSTLLSYTLGKSFNGNVFKTFGKNKTTSFLVKKTGTATIGRIGGRVLSRFVPGVGWALLIYDARTFFKQAAQEIKSGALIDGRSNNTRGTILAKKYGERE